MEGDKIIGSVASVVCFAVFVVALWVLLGRTIFIGYEFACGVAGAFMWGTYAFYLIDRE